MGRRPKYHTEEERSEARATSKRRYEVNGRYTPFSKSSISKVLYEYLYRPGLKRFKRNHLRPALNIIDLICHLPHRTTYPHCPKRMKHLIFPPCRGFLAVDSTIACFLYSQQLAPVLSSVARILYQASDLLVKLSLPTRIKRCMTSIYLVPTKRFNQILSLTIISTRNLGV